MAVKCASARSLREYVKYSTKRIATCIQVKVPHYETIRQNKSDCGVIPHDGYVRYFMPSATY
jgi:hypothetical protein